MKKHIVLSALVSLLAGAARANSLSLAVGSGVEFGDAAQYQPYLQGQKYNYVPSVGLYLFGAHYKTGIAFTGDDSKSLCFECASLVRENYGKVDADFHLRALGNAANTVYVGGGLYYQFGQNHYYKRVTDFPFTDVAYEGRLSDAYQFLGFAASVENQLFKYFNYGVRLDYPLELSRKRTNSLITRDDEGNTAPVAIATADRGRGFNVEAFIQLLIPLKN